MKRLIPLVVVAVAATLFWFRERWLPAAASHQAYLGYVEGDTTLLGAAAPGRIISLSANKGGTVEEGTVLFQIDDTALRHDITRLQAALETAKATVTNLETGKRAEELALIERQEAEASANLDLAKLEFTRAGTLNQRGVSADTQLEKARAALRVAEERVKQVQANAAIAKLPARVAEISAARSRVTEADAALAAARARLSDYQAKAPATALVDDVFFDAGEVVGAGQPIVSLFRPDKVTLRFFIPEAQRSKAQAGVSVHYTCDGCTGGSAVISHVAAIPEYTPPVIYSSTARAKLVFLVEARPTAADAHLQPGLPVEVETLP